MDPAGMIAGDGPPHEATRAVFPAYRCEFAGTENADEAGYRYSRAAGAAPTRLGREHQNRVWRVTWDGAWNVAELTGGPGERR